MQKPFPQKKAVNGETHPPYNPYPQFLREKYRPYMVCRHSGKSQKFQGKGRHLCITSYCRFSMGIFAFFSGAACRIPPCIRENRRPPGFSDGGLPKCLFPGDTCFPNPQDGVLPPEDTFQRPGSKQNCLPERNHQTLPYASG